MPPSNFIMSTADAQSLADKLVSEIVGTCDTMPEWVEEHPQEIQILEFFDQEAFNCDCCGWWCEMAEAEEHPTEGTMVCAQCAAEADE